MVRGWRHGAISMTAAIALPLSGCASSPDQDLVDAAGRLRPAAAAKMAAITLDPPSGALRVADHSTDICGALTNDNGGLDDRHVNGYECVMYRDALFVVPGAGTADQSDLANRILRTNGLTDAPSPFADGVHLDHRLCPIQDVDTCGAGTIRMSLDEPRIQDGMYYGTDVSYPVQNTVISESGSYDAAGVAAARQVGADVGVQLRLSLRYYNSYSGPS